MKTHMHERWWWLSFADASRPRGLQFLGVAAVRATDLAGAMRAAWRAGCNPGGQVRGSTMSETYGPPPPELDHRLVSDPSDLDRLTCIWTGNGVERTSRYEES